jgi:hypothetical protein
VPAVCFMLVVLIAAPADGRSAFLELLMRRPSRVDSSGIVVHLGSASLSGRRFR